MTIRRRTVAYGLGTALALALAVLPWLAATASQVSANASQASTTETLVQAATPAYAVEVNGLHVYAPRSEGSDVISIAYSVAVNGNEYPVETVTLQRALATDADVTIATSAPAGLAPVRFDAGRTDNVVVRYVVVNAKGAGGAALAQKILTQFTTGGGHAAEDYNDTIWPNAVTPLTPASLFAANCDGAVAVDAYTLTGGQIARSIADAKGAFLVSKNYQGGDLSSGCGTHSNYDVIIRFGANAPKAAS